MSGEYQETKLKDPLSDVTRKERRNLLVLSILGLAIIKTGSIPTKITALGIEFEQTDQNAILIVIAIIIIYFLIAFILYGFSDFLSWKLSFIKMRLDILRQTHEKEVKKQNTKAKQIDINLQALPTNDQLKSLHAIAREIGWNKQQLGKLDWPIAFTMSLRGFFEFILPILIGSYSIWGLFSYVYLAP